MEREAVVRPPLFFFFFIIDRFLLPFIYSYLCQHMIDMINLRAIASVVTMLVGLMSQTAACKTQILDGYDYDMFPAEPDGSEWQSPQRLALNKEQPRATFELHPKS